MAISGRHPRSVLAAVKTVLAPRFVIARSEATWQSREGTAVRNEPSKNGMHPRFVIARSEATWQSREGTAVRNEPSKNGMHPRFVIARSEATWQSREGTAVRNEPSKNGMHPRFVIARSEATWQSREGTPDPYWPPLKQCWPPDLSLRGGRRPTWQSRSTRSDNRKASANSTPRKAVKI